ncbi:MULTISPECIES: flagella biosynthesis regulatory protein FliT [Scandinavium]|jgi:flagellar protein FliT|uniref:Flagellar protein FliT n=1 Tax=Scandinavium goeteborgense TaxID=1851514 RepID=A0A4R6ELL0_SCAGO|nr:MULTISPECIES: flagella biosynthesis regulatory protein FliT [Scandinavium]MCS2171660.1 flagella biosynthesis regulatory protein FliT [Scandinavium tedordense]QKN81330.1 flagella biosynthesis regulatory protein FliT [Scandinavium goeteborgense]TDN59875.1 flagellar protein FliT [Scandinavium goeteborgense]
MSTAPQLYSLYQQLLDRSLVMLRFATEGQWDELIACEMEYVSAVQKLAEITQQTEPSTVIQDQLRPVLRAILDNETEVKRLLQARMEELAKLVGQSTIQKSVLTTYGKQGGHVLVPQESRDTPTN